MEDAIRVLPPLMPTGDGLGVVLFSADCGVAIMKAIRFKELRLYTSFDGA